MVRQVVVACLCAASLLGCNLLFSLDEAGQRTASGGGGSGATGAGATGAGAAGGTAAEGGGGGGSVGGAGGGGMGGGTGGCDPNETELPGRDVLFNGSFESNSFWSSAPYSLVDDARCGCTSGQMNATAYDELRQKINLAGPGKIHLFAALKAPMFVDTSVVIREETGPEVQPPVGFGSPGPDGWRAANAVWDYDGPAKELTFAFIFHSREAQDIQLDCVRVTFVPD